jgi:CheY-like chemotaxis protein
MRGREALKSKKLYMCDRRGKRILLVEDEAIIAMATAFTLAGKGFEVEKAHTGEDAVQIFRKEPRPDLVLMDIDLGHGIDGTEATRRILQNHDVPVIFVTNHTGTDVAEKLKSITHYGYVLKNAGDRVLLESVSHALELFETRR